MLFRYNMLIKEEFVMTPTRTLPARAAARHGFPLPLTGVAGADARMLLLHAPLKVATFHATFEGELFAVDRTIHGDVTSLLNSRSSWSDVAIYSYRPALLDALIGRQELLRGAEAVTDDPSTSCLLVGGLTRLQLAGDDLVTVADRYRRI
jgi:hypothetical protein